MADPSSPTPKAAHSRTFWRDIVRRVSRSPTTDNFSPSITTSLQSPEPPIQLVEINPNARQHTDAERKSQVDPVNTSAFDDLPPAEQYDPAWYNNPLRGEAGRLGRATGPNAPLLPGAFTIKSSDLDDDDDDDDDDDGDDEDDDSELHHPHHPSQHTHHETPIPPTLPETSSTAPTPTPTIPDRDRAPPIPMIPAPHTERQPRDSERSVRSRRSMPWRKQSAKAPPQTPVKSRSTQRKPSAFDSPFTQEKTIQLLTAALNFLRADFMAFKQNEIRARVPVTTKDQTVVQVIVVISLDQRPASCRVSVRKSFADSFRISSEEFDCFCSELQKRFRELQHADST